MSDSPSGRFEAAILANLDDVDVYVVYADWLQSQGDPRGELIMLQNQLQSIATRRARLAVQKTCDDLIARHGLLGPLAAFPLGASSHGRHANVTWRNGFIRNLELGWGPTDYDPLTQRQELEAILMHPSSLFITTLTLGLPAAAGPGPAMLWMIDAITSTGRPAALRTLRFGHSLGPDQIRTGDLSALCPVLRRLERLEVAAATIKLGTLELPALRELRIVPHRMTADIVADLAAARCPALERLEIHFHDEDAYPNDLASLFHSPTVANLRHLVLTGCIWNGDLVTVLASAPILPHLASLDLSHGQLGEADATTLASLAARFPNLAELDVSQNALPERSRAVLARLAARVEFDEQDPDDDGEVEQDQWDT